MARASLGPARVSGRCAGYRGGPGRSPSPPRLASGRSALASAVLVHDLRVDDFVVGRRLRAVVSRALLSTGLLRLGLLVDGGTHLLADLRGPLGGRLDGVGVVALQRLLDLGDRLADLGLDVIRHLVLVLAEELLGAVD